MSRSVRLSEYYDLFDIVVQPDKTTSLNNNDVLNNDIQNMNITNPFIGFSNWADFKANNQTETPHGSGTYKANNIIKVEAKHFSPQALNTVSIDEQGNISCYPPNAPVPYWNKVIFRNFDFQFHPHNIVNDSLPDKYQAMIKANYLNSYITDSDTAKDILDYDNVPLFLRYPEYRSRSHVIFSACDKTRNPDIEHIFGYNHGATEPIILNLSMSASNFITGISNFTVGGTTYNAGTRYNENLNKDCINHLLTKCYFCVEWVYEAKGVNTD